MGRGASQEFDHTKEPPTLTMAEEIDPAQQEAYVQELVGLDLREEWDSDSDGEDDTEHDSAASDPPAAGSSASSEPSSSSPSEPASKKYRSGRNRPVFVKTKPPKRGEIGYEMYVPDHFTMAELESDFCATWEYVFEHRVTWYARKMEDHLQELINGIPFGMVLHRHVGCGARTCVADGMPGYLARVGVCAYKLCDWEWEGNKLISVTGINKTGDKRTKAYILH